MRFYAVRCGQMRRFWDLGKGKTGQDAAWEVQKTASGRVNAASWGQWVGEDAGGESMAVRSVLPDSAVGAGYNSHFLLSGGANPSLLAGSNRNQPALG